MAEQEEITSVAKHGTSQTVSKQNAHTAMNIQNNLRVLLGGCWLFAPLNVCSLLNLMYSAVNHLDFARPSKVSRCSTRCERSHYKLGRYCGVHISAYTDPRRTCGRGPLKRRSPHLSLQGHDPRNDVLKPYWQSQVTNAHLVGKLPRPVCLFMPCFGGGAVTRQLLLRTCLCASEPSLPARAGLLEGRVR